MVNPDTDARLQLPLILAWAMSIHKSQGQTIERVKVDLNRVFEKGQRLSTHVLLECLSFVGQVYVALSRAVSLEGLQVLNFQGNTVRAESCVDK